MHNAQMCSLYWPILTVIMSYILQSILDPFSKILSYSIQNWELKYNSVVDLCHLCHRGFMRVCFTGINIECIFFYFSCTRIRMNNSVCVQEREKLLLTRVAVYELVQAMKFKTDIPDKNFLILLTFILQVGD